MHCARVQGGHYNRCQTDYCTLGVGYQYLTALKGSWFSDLPSTNTSLLGKMMKTIPEVSVRPSEQYQPRPFSEDPRVGASVVFRHP